MAVKKDPEFHRKESIFATQSVATVAAAVERDVALSALAEQSARASGHHVRSSWIRTGHLLPRAPRLKMHGRPAP